MNCPPEYIIEEENYGGLRCVIYDPPSGGEYSSFSIDRRESKNTIKSRIQKALDDAYDEYYEGFKCLHLKPCYTKLK
jgi:hypothetical protein